MNKQFKDLLELYKEYIKIFNNWQFSKNDDLDFFNMNRLQNIFLDLTKILVENKIIEQYGIKHYKVIESGEII